MADTITFRFDPVDDVGFVATPGNEISWTLQAVVLSQNLISDATAIDPALSDASAVADFLIGSFGGDARKVLLTAVSRLLLGATDAAAARTAIGAGTGNALTSNPLSQFAATTSEQLAALLSDETGTGSAVFATSPTFAGTAAFTNITATGTVAAGSSGQFAIADLGTLTINAADGSNPDTDTTANRQFRLQTGGTTWAYISRWASGAGIRLQLGGLRLNTSTSGGATISATGGLDLRGTGSVGFIHSTTALEAITDGSTFFIRNGNAPAATRFVTRGLAGQTGALQQWQDSASNVLASISAGGNITTAGTVISTPITPAQITADTNNYAPTAGGMFYRLNTDASRTVTGLSISQVNGQITEIWNVGSFNLVLAHDSASSTAANRFLCTGAANITLAPDEIALIRYDSTTSRWRVRKI